MTDTTQLVVNKYMDVNYPNINDFNGGLKPFKYKGKLFYPVASNPITNNKIDSILDYNNWCVYFSKSIDYDWDSFYNVAKIYGYGNCNVFGCNVNGKIHYFVPTTYIFTEFPMKHLLGNNTEKIDNMINDILQTKHTK